jgi:ribosome-binding protein aMBF1 (putative translation factor)
MTHIGSAWKDVRKEVLADPEAQEEYARLESDRLLKRQIAAARRAKGLTQRELAIKVGTRQSAISRLENEGARFNPGLDDLRKIAKALDKKLRVELI